MDAQIPRQGIVKRAWRRVIRLGFRLLYNELACAYDAVSAAVSLGQWRDWQRTALSHLNVMPGAAVLELAHGTGNFVLDLHAAGFRVVGLDLSRAMGRLAQRKLRRQGVPAQLVRGRGQALPFRAGAFAAAVSTFPTEFIAAPETLAEIYRVLQPGARLVIVTGGVLTRGGPAKDALELAYRVTGQRGPWTPILEARLAGAGFESETFTESLPRSLAALVVARKPVHDPTIHRERIDL